MEVINMRSLLGALVAVLLAVSALGCGDSDGGADSSAAKAGPDEREIRATLAKMGERMGEADGAGACSYMTAAARKQLAAGIEQLSQTDSGFAERGGDSGKCAGAFRAILTANTIEDLDPPIVSVKVDGSRAVVAARPSHDKGNFQYAQLARENGEWRVVEWFARDSGSVKSGEEGS